MQWVIKIVSLWKHKDDKNKVIYILSTMLLFAIASLAWSNYQKGVTEKRLSKAEESLKAAEQLNYRRAQEYLINEALRAELDQALRLREQELRKVREELGSEIAGINEEYQELLRKAQNGEPGSNDSLTDSEESCYGQIETLARRAASGANERMWEFYNHRVSN